MRIAPLALTAAAVAVLLMCALAGLLFLGVAVYLGIAAAVQPVFAALITAAILLLPLLLAGLLLFWQLQRRRLQQTQRRHELDALTSALQDSARSDPYAFVTAAFISGMLLSAKSGTRLRVTRFMQLYGTLHAGG